MSMEELAIELDGGGQLEDDDADDDVKRVWLKQ